METKSHTTTSKKRNDEFELTLLVNHEGTDTYRVTVNSSGYQHQARVSVDKWTDGSGFRMITDETLDQYTNLWRGHHEGDTETEELFSEVAWKALKPVVEIFSK